jgi:hypothetical protein
MAYKFKINDLVRITVPITIGYAAFPIGTEARVKDYATRAGTRWPYRIEFTSNAAIETEVSEDEIEFVNQVQPAPKTYTYKKLVTNQGTWYIVEDNGGSHYTILDSNDSGRAAIIGSKHNKNLFVNCKEDTSWVHLPTGASQQGSNNSGLQQKINAQIGKLFRDPIPHRDVEITKPIIKPVPKCTCGCEKVYGPSYQGHSSWCDKKTA